MLAGRQRQNARAGAAGRTPAGVWPARRREDDDAGRRGRHLDRGDGQRPRVARRRPPHVRPGGERYGRRRRAWLVRTRADGQRISVYLSTVSVVRPEAAAPGLCGGCRVHGRGGAVQAVVPGRAVWYGGDGHGDAADCAAHRVRWSGEVRRARHGGDGFHNTDGYGIFSYPTAHTGGQGLSNEPLHTPHSTPQFAHKALPKHPKP